MLMNRCINKVNQNLQSNWLEGCMYLNHQFLYNLLTVSKYWLDLCCAVHHLIISIYYLFFLLSINTCIQCKY